jgi:hypothetical protein
MQMHRAMSALATLLFVAASPSRAGEPSLALSPTTPTSAQAISATLDQGCLDAPATVNGNTVTIVSTSYVDICTTNDAPTTSRSTFGPLAPGIYSVTWQVFLGHSGTDGQPVRLETSSTATLTVVAPTDVSPAPLGAAAISLSLLSLGAAGLLVLLRAKRHC